MSTVTARAVELPSGETIPEIVLARTADVDEGVVGRHPIER
jgi:hypothetical protein